MSAADRANLAMVDRLLFQGALWSRRLIEAFRQTPRHCFLDRVWQHVEGEGWREVTTSILGREEVELVYADRALTTRISQAGVLQLGVPISSSSQPSLMAQMLEDLRLREGMHVLEIGAGTGYNAALLAYVAGPGRVVSIDVDRQVLAEAEQHLRPFAQRQVRLCHADGRLGYPPAAPFDRIMVTASTTDLEPAWLEQLAPDGILLAPLSLGPGLSYVVCGRMRGDVFEGRLTRPAYFMPLRSEDDTGPSEGCGPAPPWPMEAMPAPWTGWTGARRGRSAMMGLLHGLAFFGMQRGLALSCRSLGESPAFGLSDLVRGCACWVGASRWHVSGSAGRHLGEKLWRSYLDAGTPLVTEWDLRARPGGGLCTEGPETCSRQGPRCQQVWALREERERPSLR